MKRIGIDYLDMKVEIHPVMNLKNEKFIGRPQLKIKIMRGSNFVSEYLCDSIVVDDVEYVAQYEPHEWKSQNIIETDKKNPQVKLPNGDVISEGDFGRRFIGFGEKEVLI